MKLLIPLQIYYGHLELVITMRNKPFEMSVLEFMTLISNLRKSSFS